MCIRNGSRPLIVVVAAAAALSLGTGTAHASTVDAGAVLRAGGGCGTSDPPAGDRSGDTTSNGSAGCDRVPQPYGFLFGQNGTGSIPGTGTGGGTGAGGGKGTGGGDHSDDGGVVGGIVDAVREFLGQLGADFGG